MRKPVLAVLGLALIASVLVLAIHLCTNRMPPEWDMAHYLNMATNGIVNNSHLAAPFAYRPAAPLLIGGLAKLMHTDPLTTFQRCGEAACVVFVLAGFAFARRFGATSRSALVTVLALAMYFYIVKWNIFARTMVDIYAYPLILLGFWAILRRRFLVCIAVSAIGLFFKEFLLVPIATEAALTLGCWRSARRRVWVRLGLIAIVLLSCFLVPRLLIHVWETYQDIDPINQSSSLRRLVSYPLSWRRDLNIVFAYLAWWLPSLLLLTPGRAQQSLNRLSAWRWPIGLYLLFHFALVMYGGTNLTIFVTYSLPVEILVLVTMMDGDRVPAWELAGALLVIVIFNRLWQQVPLPAVNLDRYLSYYGGYHMLVNRRTLLRFLELIAWIGAFWTARGLLNRAITPRAPVPERELVPS